MFTLTKFKAPPLCESGPRVGVRNRTASLIRVVKELLHKIKPIGEAIHHVYGTR
jgi:hypothetical protein